MVEQVGTPVGLLTLANLNKVPRQAWAVTTAAQAMTPVEQFHLLKADTGLAEALEDMNMEGINHLPVVEGGQVEGILTREGVIDFLRNLQSLHRSGTQIRL